jgi:hypothetical protein
MAVVDMASDQPSPPLPSPATAAATGTVDVAQRVAMAPDDLARFISGIRARRAMDPR